MTRGKPAKRPWRRRLWIAASILLGLPALASAIVLAYLNFADLGRYRGTLETLVTEALGRELTIAGDFEPEFGFTCGVVAGEITLANPEWSSVAAMVRVERLAIRFELLSLVSGPIRIHDLEIRGVRVLLESDGDGRANWQFDLPASEPGAESGPPAAIVAERVVVDDLTLIYRDAALARPLELSRAKIEIRSADEEMLDLAFDGRYNGVPVSLAGRVGPLAGLVQLANAEVDLTGGVAGADVTLEGTVADLGSLAGTNARLAVIGPDIAAVTESFDLPEIGQGPFRLDVRVSPESGHFDFSVEAHADQIRIEAEGQLDSIVEPTAVDARVNASGPDIAALGELFGLTDLPGEPFDVSGRLHSEGYPIAFEDVVVGVGPAALTLDGLLGAPPTMMQTDFRFHTEGPDLAAFRALAGRELPAGAFRARGRLLRVEEGIRVESVAAAVGETTLQVDGFVGDPPEMIGTKLDLELNGNDLSDFSAVAAVELPAGPFSIHGSFGHAGDGIALDSVEAALGDTRVRLRGTVRVADGLVGTNVHVSGEGTDLSHVAALAGQSGWPADRFRFEVGVGVLNDGYAIDAAKAQLADLRIDAEGRLGALPDLDGTDLRIEVEGPDLAWVGRLAGEELPAETFHVAADLRAGEDGYELRAVDALIGDTAVKLHGHVGAGSDFEGTELSLDVRGDRLSALGAYVDQVLPEIPFAVLGQVGVSGEAFRFDDMTVELDETRAGIDGVVVATESMAGTRLELDVVGPDLAGFGRHLSESGLADLPELPAVAFSVAGEIEVDEAGYLLRDVEFGLHRGTARLDGRVGPPPDLRGTDLAVEARGPDASRIGELAGHELPAGPFELHGRVEVLQSGYRFHDLRVAIGADHARVDGILGEPPELIGTRLDLDAAGASLGRVAELAGRSGLPEEPFEISGQFEGTPERFSVQTFAARLGAIDLGGSLQIDLRDRPAVHGELHSNRIDLSAYIGRDDETQPTEDDDTDSAVEVLDPDEPFDEVVEVGDELLLSDETFDLEALHEFDADVRIDVGQLIVPPLRARDVRLGLQLVDGALRIDPVSGTEEIGGTFSGALTLEPVGKDYRTRVRLLVQEFKLDMTADEDDPSIWPTLDLDLDLGATGRSPHSLAGDLSGHFEMKVVEGMMDNSLVEILAAGIIRQLLTTLNPFVKEDSQTRLDCVVFASELQDGKARLDPIVMRTDKMVILGHGAIDWSTEGLDLDWVAKPRKGLGISVGAFTNALIKLGGTLSEPKIQSKGIGGVAKGSLSVLTLGIANRITAERKVCKKALKQLEERKQGR